MQAVPPTSLPISKLIMLPSGSPAFAASICARESATSLLKKLSPRMNCIPVALFNLLNASHTCGSGTVTCLSVLPPPTRRTSGPLPYDCSNFIIFVYWGTSLSLQHRKGKACERGSYCKLLQLSVVFRLHSIKQCCLAASFRRIYYLLFYARPFMAESHEGLRNGVAWLVNISQGGRGKRAC